MRFIVCARSREDGETYVVGSTSYADKDAAIAALGRSASLAQLADRELYVVDLDAGTPIVLVNTRPLAAPQMQAPEQPVLEALVGQAEPSESGQDEAEDDAPAAPAFIARAEASSGAPIGSDDEPMTFSVDQPDEIGQRLEDSDLWSLVGSLDQPDPADMLDATGVPDATDMPSVADAEPWWLQSHVRSESSRPTLYDADQVPSEVPVEHTAVTASDTTPLHDRRDSEPTDAEDLPLEAESGVPFDAAEQPLLDTSPYDGEWQRVFNAGADDTDGSGDGFATDRTAPEADARVDAEPVPDVTETPEAGDAATLYLQVDFDAWTCTDCVFTSTCDQTDESVPADCGSFQWRPE